MTCERCGLDLETLGMYAGFIHYRLGSNRDWCLPDEKFSPEVERIIAAWSKELTERTMATLERISE